MILFIVVVDCFGIVDHLGAANHLSLVDHIDFFMAPKLVFIFSSHVTYRRRTRERASRADQRGLKVCWL